MPLFELNFVNCNVDQIVKYMFSHIIITDARSFALPVLPSQFRIPVLILDRESFRSQLETTQLKRFGIRDCVAFSDSSIHVLAYQYLSGNVKRTDYLRAIRHECIHVLQHLASKVPPHEMIWLYEAVACAMANQRRRMPVNPPTWSSFTREFYGIPACYAVAYHFGNALLETFSLDKLIALSMQRKQCLRIFRKIYRITFNK